MNHYTLCHAYYRRAECYWCLWREGAIEYWAYYTNSWRNAWFLSGLIKLWANTNYILLLTPSPPKKKVCQGTCWLLKYIIKLICNLHRHHFKWKSMSFGWQEIQFGALTCIMLDLQNMINHATHIRLWKEHVQTKCKHLIDWKKFGRTPKINSR